MATRTSPQQRADRGERDARLVFRAIGKVVAELLFLRRPMPAELVARVLLHRAVAVLVDELGKEGALAILVDAINLQRPAASQLTLLYGSPADAESPQQAPPALVH